MTVEDASKSFKCYYPDLVSQSISQFSSKTPRSPPWDLRRWKHSEALIMFQALHVRRESIHQQQLHQVSMKLSQNAFSYFLFSWTCEHRLLQRLRLIITFHSFKTSWNLSSLSRGLTSWQCWSRSSVSSGTDLFKHVPMRREWRWS